MNENQSYKGFTVGLAAVDCLPVLLCGITLGILAARLNSVLFAIGTILVIGAGALKCLWKFIVALTGKDIKVLFYQMRGVMPVGFVLLIIAVIVNQISASALWSQITAFPNMIFYLLGIAGMICMTWFAKHLDSTDAKSNWIEQLTNATAQFCFLLGVVL